MKSIPFLLILFFVILFPKQSISKEKSEGTPVNKLSQIPSFILQNEGQLNPNIKYTCKSVNSEVYFMDNSIVYQYFNKIKPEEPFSLNTNNESFVENIGLAFGNRKVPLVYEITGVKEGKVNYFKGNDPLLWKRDIPTFEGLKLKNVFRNIDLIYNSSGSAFKTDFVIHSGANINDIILKYSGIRYCEIGRRGELLIHTERGLLTENIPMSYQLIGGEIVKVDIKYYLIDGQSVGFTATQYDRRYDLIIDPAIIYSTYIGSSDNDELHYGNLVRDNFDNIIFTGRTSGNDFPTVPGSYDVTYNNGNYDAFVIKLNPSGTSLVFATYLGSSGTDVGYDVALDQNQNIVVTGCAGAANFPLTPGAFQTTYTGSALDAFVLKLNTNGNILMFSTLLGGSNDDEGVGIVVDNNDFIYVTGEAHSGFPVTPGAYQTIHGGSGGDYDYFVTKINPSGANLVYSTFIGGSGEDRGSRIVIDNLGNAYVTGQTDGSFPITAGAFDATHNGSNDVAIIKLNSTGTALLYSTYLGGPGNDWPTSGLVLNTLGELTFTGYCENGFPVTNGAYDQTYNGGTSDGFVCRINASGSALIFSTYLGTNAADQAWSLDINSANKIYVTGKVGAGFATTTCAYDNSYNGGTTDAFIVRLNGNASQLEYSSYFGGSGDDVGRAILADGDTVYLAGESSSSNLPVSSGCFDPVFNGGTNDVFALKLSMEIDVLADFSMNDTICEGDTVHFLSQGSIGLTYLWNFGDNTTSSMSNPSHIYTLPGAYNVTLTASNTCGSVTVSHPVFVMGNPLNIGDTLQVSNLGLISRYPFNNNVLDVSGHNLHGSLFGAIPVTDNCQNPLSSYLLNGNGNYIELPHSFLYNSMPLSFSYWFKKNNNSIQLTAGLGYSEYLLVKNDDLGADLHFAMWLNNQYPPWEVALGAGNGSIVTTISYPDSVFPNTWYHIGGVLRSNKLYLYFNGNLADSVSFSGAIQTNTFPFLVGKSPDYSSTRWLNGNIEEMRYYGRELSSCEYKLLWQKCNPPVLGVSQADTLICTSNSSCINVINPQYGIVYQLLTYPGLTPVSSPVYSNCDDTLCLNTGPLNLSANFIISACYPGNLCPIYLDSTFHITVQPAISIQQDETICQGDSVFLGGAWQITSGIYHDTIPAPGLICDTIIQTNLTVFPTYHFLDTISICQTDSVLFNGVYIHNTGVYYANLQTGEGCDSVLQLSVIVFPYYTITFSDSICQGDSILFNGYYLFNSGIYTDTLYSGTSCDSIMNLTLWVKPVPIVNLPSDTAFCINDNTNITVQGSSYSFLWSTGETSGTLHVLQTGMYTLTVTNSSGCQSVDSVMVTLYPEPLILIQPSDPVICADSSVQLQVSGASFYQWSPGTSLSSTTDSIVIASPALNTTYSVTGTTNAGCSGDTTVLVSVVMPPAGTLPDSLYVCEGESILLDPGYCFGCTYIWSDNNTNQTYNATEPGDYWVRITDHGCSSLDSISLKDCMEIWIPNTFTPNGDGFNEIFLIKGVNLISFHMYIFNRWGMQLYETKDIYQGWDGKYKGDMCADGVYIYLVIYTGYKSGRQIIEKKVAGAVTLLR